MAITRSPIEIVEQVSTGKLTKNRGVWVAKITRKDTGAYVTNVSFIKNKSGFYYHLNTDFGNRGAMNTAYHQKVARVRIEVDSHTLVNIKPFDSVHQCENEIRRLFNTSITLFRSNEELGWTEDDIPF